MKRPVDDPPQDAAAGSGWLTTLLEAAGDRLNPILVKETRQALKSRQFTLWFVLLLIACWVTTLGAIAVIGPSIYYVSAGGYLLYAYYVILALPLMVVVPFSAYRSLSSEHEENTRDLLEVSTLTPRQVINGKLGSALLQILIYCSALAPCIAFTYLLRGVELLTIGVLIVYVVLASIGLAVIGLVIAAGTRQKYAQVVLSVAFAGVLFSAFSGLLAGVAEVLQLDASEIKGERFWWLQLAILSLFLTSFALAYEAAIALTTFSSANRSTRLRFALFAQQAVYVAWVSVAFVINAPRDFLFDCFVIAAFYWFGAGALMTGESPTLSLRVRRSLPQSWLGRAVGTWFNPGSGSGYVFAVTNLATLACLLGGVVLTIVGPGNVAPEQMAKAIGLLLAYVAFYLGIGRLTLIAVRRVAEVSALGGFLIQVLLLLGGSGLPYVMQTISNRFRINDLSFFTVPSPWWNVPRVLDGLAPPDRELILLITVGAAAIAVFVINLAMAGHEARQLRVATPQRVLDDDREQEPEPEVLPTNPWGDRVEPAADATG